MPGGSPRGDEDTPVHAEMGKGQTMAKQSLRAHNYS